MTFIEHWLYLEKRNNIKILMFKNREIDITNEIRLLLYKY